MTSSRPPALAVALLERVSSGDDALVGDLLEEFERGRSRVWFWRQVLGAAVMAPFRTRPEPRPLDLVDEHDRGRFESRLPPHDIRRRRINLAASPLPGIGGLGLALLIAVATFAQPQIWIAALVVVAAGVLFGVARILLLRH